MVVAVSQPSVSLLLLQSPNPDAHAPVHTPAAQVRVAMFVPEHTLAVHAPQWSGSVCRFTSQPFVRSPSQFAKPAVQVIPQTLAAHAAVPLVVLHAAEQAPQFVALVVVLTSQPLAALLSQFSYPALHTIPHCPPLHVAVPLVALHAVAQLPHFAAFAFVFVSQPFSTVPSQFPYPTLHAIPHSPLLHVAVPLVPLHVVAHVPQRLGVVCRLTSQPLAGSLSQFP